MNNQEKKTVDIALLVVNELKLAREQNQKVVIHVPK